MITSKTITAYAEIDSGAEAKTSIIIIPFAGINESGMPSVKVIVMISLFLA